MNSPIIANSPPFSINAYWIPESMNKSPKKLVIVLNGEVCSSPIRFVLYASSKTIIEFNQNIFFLIQIVREIANAIRSPIIPNNFIHCAAYVSRSPNVRSVCGR